MWIKKKRYDDMVSNFGTLQEQMGVVLENIEQYSSVAINRDRPYRSAIAQRAEVRGKYQGVSVYGGNMLCQRLVDLRVAFSVPNRLFLVKNDKVKASDAEVKEAKNFLNEFMARNLLDSSLPRDLAKESELDGQVLTRLVWERASKVPIIKYYPIGSVGYKIGALDKYGVKPELTAEFKINGKDIKLQDDTFTFIAFHDTLTLYKGYPTCGAILKTLENIDADLLDWRKLNHLFAHPTPHFKCESQEEAIAINDMIKTTGWHVGTAIATNADFQLKGTTGVESNLLMLSIQTNAKIISGHTGVGIHFLGFSNVMSNRATAESLGEPTEVALHAEIASWHAFYSDLLNKAIRMRNGKLNKPIREGLIIAKIVPLTDRQWRTIKEIYMPAAEKGLISQDTFLDMIPGVDTDAEKERIIEQQAKQLEEDKVRSSFQSNDDNSDDDGNTDENNDE